MGVAGSQARLARAAFVTAWTRSAGRPPGGQQPLPVACPLAIAACGCPAPAGVRHPEATNLWTRIASLVATRPVEFHPWNILGTARPASAELCDSRCHSETIRVKVSRAPGAISYVLQNARNNLQSVAPERVETPSFLCLGGAVVLALWRETTLTLDK